MYMISVVGIPVRLSDIQTPMRSPLVPWRAA
jgi:hypothetical protein